MGKYFDINGTAMIYISIDKAKSKDDANLHIAKMCKQSKKPLKTTFNN